MEKEGYYDRDLVLFLGDNPSIKSKLYNVRKSRIIKSDVKQTVTGVCKVGGTDQNHIALATSKQTVSLFNIRKLEEVAKFHGTHNNTVRSVVSKGNLVYDESMDKTVCVYDVTKKKCLKSWQVQNKECSVWVKQLFYVDEKDLLSIPSNEKGVIIFDPEKGEPLFHLKNKSKDPVYYTPVDMKLKVVFTLGKCGQIGIFDIRNGERAITTENVQCEGSVRSMCFSHHYFGENTIIASEGRWDSPNNLVVFDPRKNFEIVKRFHKVHKRFITSIQAYSHKTFLTCSWDGMAKMHDCHGVSEQYKVFDAAVNINCMYHYGEFELRSRLMKVLDPDLVERVGFVILNQSNFIVRSSGGVHDLMSLPKVFLFL